MPSLQSSLISLTSINVISFFSANFLTSFASKVSIFLLASSTLHPSSIASSELPCEFNISHAFLVAFFTSQVATTIGFDGLLLIGFDLKKDIETLLAAYDDQQGITASFNKNLLSRINDELGGNFNLDTFEHVARYNENKGRIEMHLKSTTEQTVSINKELFEFLEGETIHTENCYKFTEENFTAMSSKAGLYPVKTWTDDQNLFAVMLLRTTSNL